MAGLPFEAWQSILFVPVTNPRYLRKACESEAHAILLDLEDGIAPIDKARAREALAPAAERLAAAGKAMAVRVNQPLELAVLDIPAAVAAGAEVLMLPKVLGPAHVWLIDDLVARAELRSERPPGSVRYICVLETAAAYGQAAAVAACSRRVGGLMLGGEDLARECGCEPAEEVMRGFKMQVMLAARGAGVRPLGALGSIAEFRDLAAYEAMLTRTRQAGLDGVTCIHPSQVPVINAVFKPGAERLAAARQLVAKAEQVFATGRGAFEWEGRMVDAPIVERARRLLDLHS